LYARRRTESALRSSSCNSAASAANNFSGVATCRTGATIIPVAAWGQEQALGAWRRLKRPDIHIHIGEPFRLPAGAERARTAELHGYTDELMMTLARMLPEKYRGVYADRVRSEGE